MEALISSCKEYEKHRKKAASWMELLQRGASRRQDLLHYLSTTTASSSRQTEEKGNRGRSCSEKESEKEESRAEGRWQEERINGSKSTSYLSNDEYGVLNWFSSSAIKEDHDDMNSFFVVEQILVQYNKDMEGYLRSLSQVIHLMEDVVRDKLNKKCLVVLMQALYTSTSTERQIEDESDEEDDQQNCVEGPPQQTVIFTSSSSASSTVSVSPGRGSMSPEQRKKLLQESQLTFFGSPNSKQQKEKNSKNKNDHVQEGGRGGEDQEREKKTKNKKASSQHERLASSSRLLYYSGERQGFSLCMVYQCAAQVYQLLHAHCQLLVESLTTMRRVLSLEYSSCASSSSEKANAVEVLTEWAMEVYEVNPLLRALEEVRVCQRHSHLGVPASQRGWQQDVAHPSASTAVKDGGIAAFTILNNNKNAKIERISSEVQRHEPSMYKNDREEIQQYGSTTQQLHASLRLLLLYL